jgi:hypothetical protein
MRRVIVHIENLVLRGFRYEDRHAISGGLQEELMRLLQMPETAQQLAQIGGLPRLRVGPLHLAADAKPRQIGIATADGIGTGIG